METLEAIRTRRSIRSFKSKDVPERVLKQVLEAGMMAPSAGNQQPWHFVVIRDREMLDSIPSFHPYSIMVRQAPMAILVCADHELASRHHDFWVQDCSAAVQNMLLAIHDLGLAAVWVSSYPNKERVAGFRKLCSLPDSVDPLALVVLGYSDQKGGKVERFRAERVHHNTW